jgi:hypothetical protein
MASNVRTGSKTVSAEAIHPLKLSKTMAAAETGNRRSGRTSVLPMQLARWVCPGSARNSRLKQIDWICDFGFMVGSGFEV